MKSKERFKSACEYKITDRVPVDYYGSHPQTEKKLREYLGVNTEEELLDRLGCDLYYLPGRDISQNEGFMFYYKGISTSYTDTQRVCPFGIRWLRGSFDSKFMVDEALEGPFQKGAGIKDILSHKWPVPSDFDFSGLHGECESHSKRVIVGGLWTGIMGDSYRMYGFENFLTDIALKPDIVITLIDKLTDVYLELNNAIFSELKGKVDVWYFGNDFGSQMGLLLNPEMWFDFFFNNIKKLACLAHSYGLKVMMHSCGGICDIIPYLIEAGVDIIDPIQITAKGMEPEKLVDQFGGKILFHGGIDTQHLLPEGSVEDVTEQTLKMIRVMNKKGGYILSPSQTIGSDVPPENIAAMYDAVK